MDRNLYAEDVVRPVERLGPRDIRRVRGVKGDSERFGEDEGPEDERPEPTPDKRHEEVLPEVPRTVLPPSEQPEPVDHPDESISGIAHPDADHRRQGPVEHERRVQLAIALRTVHADALFD